MRLPIYGRASFKSELFKGRSKNNEGCWPEHVTRNLGVETVLLIDDILLDNMTWKYEISWDFMALYLVNPRR